jgi:hypothetical protein
MNHSAPSMPSNLLLAVFFAVALSAGPASAAESVVDLTQAVIVTAPGLTGPEKKAVAMLADEAEKRVQFRWKQSENWPADPVPVIAIGQVAALQNLSNTGGAKLAGSDAKPRPEGYQIETVRGKDAAVVWVAGNDARGVLFGVGHLLRTLRMEKRKVTLPAEFKVTTAPHYAVRGHQLGYRPKTNSYDGWNLALWEQYIRDLVIFGANSVELIPPRSDDDADSPHFPLPPMETMVGMSQLCADYGLDVWIWYPAMEQIIPTRKRLNLPSRNGARCSRSYHASMPCSCPAATPATPARVT